MIFWSRYTSKLIKLSCKICNENELLSFPCDYFNSKSHGKFCSKKKNLINSKEKEAYEILWTTTVDDVYNRACLESLSGNELKAKKNLKSALDEKRISRVQVLFDPDFYLFTSCLEEFLRDQPDDKNMLDEIRYILSKESKYIRASFESSIRNKKEAYELLISLRKDLIKNKEEILWSKHLEKFILDPNFYAIRNIAVICSNHPESPAPRSEIRLNIKVINTCNDTLMDLFIIASIPKNLRLLSDSKRGVVSETDITWKLSTLYSWEEHNIDLIVFADVWYDVELRLTVNASGKIGGHEVSNNDNLIIKVRNPDC